MGGHCDNKAIFALAKEAGNEEDHLDLARITRGSPTYIINAECSQENYRAYCDYVIERCETQFLPLDVRSVNAGLLREYEDNASWHC